MNTPRLLERSLKPMLDEALNDTPVVCILGPRQCGKTTLAKLLAPDRTYITLDNDEYFKTASSDPQGFINHLPPMVTLDEIQRVPELLHAIKYTVDEDRQPGRFLLTGSANLFLLPHVAESLAGRMETVYLHPLSESEFEQHPGAFLAQFLTSRLQPAITGGSLASSSLVERIIAGGYPEPRQRAPQRARQWHRQYLKAIIERDVKDTANIRDANELARLLELVSHRSAELLNINNLAGTLGISRSTTDHYLQILERLFLIRRLPAWHRNASKRLVKTPKIHLVDSGLTSTLTGLTARDWNKRREKLGHILESFVLQQLLSQAGWTNQDLHFWHYRDKDKVEVDIVITSGEKTWGIEIKSAASVQASDSKGLARLAAQCGPDFIGGIVLYGGQDTLPIAETPFLAVPVSRLWEL